nr:PREDICTED: WD repeat-containing protein mio isoform X2 [Bemisia tabaci]
MSTPRLEVQWSPVHPDRFITWGTEIFLYETVEIKEETKASCVFLSDNTVAHLLASNSNHHYVKCVDIYPHPQPDVLLAIGQANGKVVLTSFGSSVFDNMGLTGIEIGPRHARQCNSVAWNPSDGHLLASALDKHRADHAVQVWDVQKYPIQQRQFPTHFVSSQPSAEYSRPVVEFGLADVAHSLAWFKENPRILVVGVNNKQLRIVDIRGVLTDYSVFERMTLNWSPCSHVVWTFGRRTLKMISEKDENVYSQLDDVSVLIKERALSGYGLKPDLAQNGDLVTDEALKNVWQWLHLSKSLVEQGAISPHATSKHPGIRCVIGLDSLSNSSTLRSELTVQLWSDCQVSAKIYRSTEREKALQLCGWRSYDVSSNNIATFVMQLEGKGAFSRAATIAIFNLKLRLAVDILNRGAVSVPHLNIVAMAVSGFSDSKSGMWRELCTSSMLQLSDPYLRAMFAFLTSESDSYDGVLTEQGILVSDRVAFACMFLNDSRLCDYLGTLTSWIIEEGNLSGLFLTGAGVDAIPLLQCYLDVTGDVQSVSLITVRSFPPELIQENLHLQNWIQCYRNLLDSWRLWNQRALFDISLNASKPPPQQVFVSCNFCGKSISAYMQGLTRGRGPFVRLGVTPNKLKITCCPNCRKPQPRCAICLVNMGTASCYSGPNSLLAVSNNKFDSKLSEFSSWFTWCQTCRHGGHALHMTQWFKDHLECPVTACTCRCFSLDAASRMNSIHPVVS